MPVFKAMLCNPKDVSPIARLLSLTYMFPDKHVLDYLGFRVNAEEDCLKKPPAFPGSYQDEHSCLWVAF